MLGQIESGAYCPLAMTYGSVPTLRHAPQIADEWLPRIYSRDYDRRFPPARLKTSALVGMGMTENQGGSDLRTNTTRAQPSAADRQLSASTATSGSCRRRCAMRFLCWPKRRTA